MNLPALAGLSIYAHAGFTLSRSDSKSQSNFMTT
ncbi:hypothetical protein CJA_1053 [Cellvibrio japonicus Ueda107]|uniref:Uncharacterized protein n=1 Tax=Cellvibrio japonicus (strain Ueda107) TaxID=498211 RepID=B3PB81_CELJU|nr:hypothetical protein CJA_1053 [Cellvibrio japonicus Ueda107]